MSDRRGRKARMKDMLPKDRVRWAREIWADREACTTTPSGTGMLRAAAKVLGLPEEAVDELLRDGRKD